MKRKVFYLAIFVFILFFSACDFSEMTSSLEKNEQSSINATESISCYIEDFVIENDNCTFDLTGIDERFDINNSISFYFNITNLSTDSRILNVSNYRIIRESNDAKYNVSSYLFFDDVQIDCDITKQIYFYSTLPTLLSCENYYFEIDCGDFTYIFYLYETPDNLREQVVVNYYCDDAFVGLSYVPKGRKFADYGIIPWISEDYIYCCNDWFLNSAKTQLIDSNYTINNETTLYGRKQQILRYNLPTSTSSAFISGVNIVPNNGEIVIPSSYNGKSIYSVLAGTFREIDGLKTIYIPLGIHVSSSSNFTTCDDLTTIYYQGNETQWNECYGGASLPSNITIIYNTYVE